MIPVLIPRSAIRVPKFNVEDKMTSTNALPDEERPTSEQLAAEVLAAQKNLTCIGCSLIECADEENRPEFLDLYYHSAGCSMNYKPEELVKVHLPALLERYGFLTSAAMVKTTMEVFDILNNNTGFSSLV